MIIYRKGDILDALDKGEIDVLVHGCNAIGGFGSGIAGQIAKRYPDALRAYKDLISTCLSFKIPKPKRAGLSIPSSGNIKGMVINLITQIEFLPRGKDHFEYDAFRISLKHLLECHQSRKIGMPMIGAGLAGGDWKRIEAIINEVSENKEVFIYQL